MRLREIELDKSGIVLYCLSMKDRPYYLGHPRVSSGYMTPREIANEMRHIASLIPLDSYRADDRRLALTARAADIDAGQIQMRRHFRVMIPNGLKPKRNGAYPVITLPCRGCSLYTFDEAWLILEAYAARRGFAGNGENPDADAALECWAEGDNQNIDLGILYDGMAEPMKDAPVRATSTLSPAALVEATQEARALGSDCAE